ncbi:MAG: HAMP domain-containing histidine kinase [Clostridiales bacterium]|nr:HAMP domain-containing histidine kinase [Clostridiales bacterium]
MRLREFVGDKGISLCFWGLGMTGCGLVMWSAGAAIEFLVLFEGFLALIAAGWLVVSWFIESRRQRRLALLIAQLPEKYLIGAVLPKPSSLVERRYYEMMEEISRSAVGLIEQARREKEEYFDYVEQWLHEMKTPLTAASLILDNSKDVQKLRRELKRADNLTESILYYARLTESERTQKISEIFAADVFHEAVLDQRALLIAAGIQVDISGDFRVWSDKKTLCFIIKQLLINCAKYCGGCTVFLHAENGVMTVEDNGPGILPQELPRVTHKGFTGSCGRTSGSSTGMGLYIVAQLCEKLNIGLEISSSVGEYTRISLNFLHS